MTSSHKSINKSGFGVQKMFWPLCPTCKQRPKLWLFDNGCYADCSCGTPYESKARGESINSYCTRKDKSVYVRLWRFFHESKGKGWVKGYSHADLNRAWIKYTKTKQVQTKLKRGRW